MTTQTSSENRQSTKLENSTFDIIRALEKDADFLYSTVGKYIEDAEKDGRSDLVETWNTIKQDKERHVQMLREALASEAKKGKLER
jgi:hypothetical protein